MDFHATKKKKSLRTTVNTAHLDNIQGLSKKYLTLSPAKSNVTPAKWFW